MLAAEDEKTNEKERVLRKKVLNNLVAAKLRNERENEKLNKRLDNLVKEEELRLRKMQRKVLNVRRELLQSTKSVEPAKTDRKISHTCTSTRVEKPLQPTPEHELKTELETEAEPETNPKPVRRRFPVLSNPAKVPMSFLELKQLPPLQKSSAGMIEWPPKPERDSNQALFPQSKILGRNGRRNTVMLPRIARAEVVGSDSAVPPPRQRRFMSSPAVLGNVRSVSEESLTTIASE